jgi:glutathione S-transferase
LITLYGFGTIHPAGRGETKDLRAQWALEEIGLPYRVHALDHTGGELDGDAYGRISPFRQVPVIDDDGFLVAESAAVVLYLAEKGGKLIPGDVQGRTRVVQWCFAADGSLPKAQGVLRALFRPPGVAAHPRPLRRATRREH